MSLPLTRQELETRRQMLGLLHNHTPGSAITNLLMGSLCAGFLWQETGSGAYWLWFAVLCLAIFPRLFWWHWLGKRLAQFEQPQLLLAEQSGILLVALSGATWGGLAWMGLSGAHEPTDIFVTGTLIGLTGGAVTPLSSLRAAFPIYTCAVLGPLFVRYLSIGNHLYLSGGLGLMLYSILLLIYGRTTHRALWRSFQLQQEKDGLIAELQALSRSRSLFLAGVSHDLRQPVQALGLFTGYLRGLADEHSGKLGEELRRLSNHSGVALAAIHGQITRLLELSRLEAGEVVPRTRIVSLAELFSYTRSQQISKAEEKGLSLRFVETGLCVSSDLKMLQSILDNLVSNAVRYTQQGRVLVGVRRRGRSAEIQVWDTGSGIEAAMIPQLFEAYRRFDDTAQGSDVGFGLGLALVKKQADLLDHPIDVRSVPGRGSMFSVRVPLAE